MLRAHIGVCAKRGSAKVMISMKRPVRRNPKKVAGIVDRSFVGIFWVIQEPGSLATLLDHRCSLREAEAYGCMLTCPHGHYEMWEEWRRTLGGVNTRLKQFLRANEYEEWPRGRVVYDSESNRFTLWADRQKLQRPDLLAIIVEKFGLPADRTDAKPGRHYRKTIRLQGKCLHSQW